MVPGILYVFSKGIIQGLIFWHIVSSYVIFDVFLYDGQKKILEKLKPVFTQKGCFGNIW